MSDLTQILSLKQNLFPEIAINALLKNNGYDMTIHTSSSSVLNNAFRSLQTDWYSISTRNLAGIIAKIIARVLKTYLVFNLYYVYPNESVASITTPVELANMWSMCERPGQTLINIMFLPKGKTFLKTGLSNCENLEEIEYIKTLCTKTKTHYFRAYRNLQGFGTNNITIFTDYIDKDIATEIWAQLPHLFNIQKIENPENTTETEDKHLIDYLYKILEIIYPYQQTNAITLDESRTIICDVATKLHPITDEFLSHFDFIKGNIPKFLNNLQELHSTAQINALKRKISDLEGDIADKEYRLKNDYKALKEANLALTTYEKLTPEDIEGFSQILNNTSVIEVLESSATVLKMRVTAPLQYFESEPFKIYEKNTQSYYNEIYNNNPILKQILHKIFVTREYKLIFQAIVKMTISNQYGENEVKVEALGGNIQDFTNFPNPHLYHFNCWQETKNQLNKHLINGNYNAILPQIIAATQSVNTSESASFINNLLPDFLSKEFQDITNIIIGNKTYTLAEVIQMEKEKVKETVTTPAPTKEYKQIEIEDNDEDWEDYNTNETN